jgi:nucleotide-binding universal stress UspA family protein
MNQAMRLLIPLDGSELAERAVRYVPSLMPMGISTVQLLAVAGADSRGGHRAEESVEREEHVLASYLGGLARELGDTTTLDVRAKVLRGAPAATILEEAQAFGPDLLLISTHGASGVTRWRLGSVADKVIRSAACSTLVIGPATQEDVLEGRIMPVPRTILVPLDGSDLAEEALPFAARLSEASGAAIHVVTVVSPGDMGGSSAWAGVSPGLEDALMGEAREYLEGICEASPATTHAAVRFGSPSEALEEYVPSNDIDLMVMTSHGRGGFLRTALGSTTDRLIGMAPCPILIVRRQSST